MAAVTKHNNLAQHPYHSAAQFHVIRHAPIPHGGDRGAGCRNPSRDHGHSIYCFLRLFKQGLQGLNGRRNVIQSCTKWYWCILDDVPMAIQSLSTLIGRLWETLNALPMIHPRVVLTMSQEAEGYESEPL